MFEGVLNMPVFRLHLVMFFVIITNFWSDTVFWIPTWLEDNLHFFEYFRKIALTIFLWKAWWRQSMSSSLLIYIHKNTYAPGRTASTIQTNGETTTIFIWIPILYLPMLWSILLTKPMFWCCSQRNWFGCCSWIYFLSSLLQHQTNLLGSQDSEEAM